MLCFGRIFFPYFLCEVLEDRSASRASINGSSTCDFFTASLRKDLQHICDARNARDGCHVTVEVVGASSSA